MVGNPAEHQRATRLPTHLPRPLATSRPGRCEQLQVRLGQACTDFRFDLSRPTAALQKSAHSEWSGSAAQHASKFKARRPAWLPLGAVSDNIPQVSIRLIGYRK